MIQRWLAGLLAHSLTQSVKQFSAVCRRQLRAFKSQESLGCSYRNRGSETTRNRRSSPMNEWQLLSLFYILRLLCRQTTCTLSFLKSLSTSNAPGASLEKKKKWSGCFAIIRCYEQRESEFRRCFIWSRNLSAARHGAARRGMERAGERPLHSTLLHSPIMSFLLCVFSS